MSLHIVYLNYGVHPVYITSLDGIEEGKKEQEKTYYYEDITSSII